MRDGKTELEYQTRLKEIQEATRNIIMFGVIALISYFLIFDLPELFKLSQEIKTNNSGYKKYLDSIINLE